MSIPTVNTHDQQVSSTHLLDAALSLAQTQIVGQLTEETSVDDRTMGTLGFNGALLAADLAARDALGVLWRMPLAVIVTATLCCLSPTLGLGVDLTRSIDLGPKADVFYLAYGNDPTLAAREQLLSDLGRAFSGNARRLRAKERALHAAMSILAVGLTLSVLAIGLS